MESSYLILLAQDAYDVPFRGKDGQELEDGSDTVFRYVLCSICPVKLAKPALTYYVTAGEFHNRASDWLVGTPEVGFLFPAFEDRATNLYGALLYTRNIGESREEFVDAVFHLAAPMPAAQQREAFQGLLTGALGRTAPLTRSRRSRAAVRHDSGAQGEQGTGASHHHQGDGEGGPGLLRRVPGPRGGL